MYSRAAPSGVHDWCRDIPHFQPDKTLLFFGVRRGPFDLATVEFYQNQIRTVFRLAVSEGVDTVVAEYTSAFGYLAVETLSACSQAYPQIRRYALQGRHIRYRQSYRTEPESYASFVYRAAQFGEHLYAVDGAYAFQRLQIPVDNACCEHGLL